MLSVGSLIAGYRIERVLGQGGMGAVYLVANPELPRREALKLLSAELSRDRGFRTRFLREADVASQLDHPNIVSIHRRGETEDGHLWIAMQFVDGTDADQALRSNKMTPDRAVHIVGEVAKALDYAHRQNVLHRDVKPANFLLSGPVGPDERVLLGDFGIARAFDDASLTGTGQVMATVSYAAPEVVSGETVDRRADQYSLACSLFRMLTGKTPFADAGSQAQVMVAHLKKPPPRVTEQAAWLPPALDQVLATAMAKDPNQRFATCSDFATAAKAALRQPSPDPEQTQRLTQRPPRPQPAPPPQPAPQHAPWPQNPPPRPHVPPAAAAQPTQIAQSPPRPPAPTPKPAPPATPPPQKNHRTMIIAAVIGVAVIAAAAITAIAWPSSDKSNTTTTTSTSSAATTTTPPRKTLASDTPDTPAPPAVVAAADLPGLLLSADEVGAVMGASLEADPLRDTLWDDSNGISDKDCLSAWMPAQAGTYDGSGWTDARSQVVKQPGVTKDAVSVAQAVIAYADQDKARPTVLSIPGQWQACAGRPFTVNTANGPQPWTFGQQGMPAPGLYTMAMTKQGNSNACGRALTLRGNVIIDVLACGPGLASQNVDIANKIAAKVPQ